MDKKIKKNREDCFFGMHFDFHATKYCEPLGSKFNYKDLELFLDTVKPDFVQCDTKGHPGYSSYPTKVGNPTPKIATDTLKYWRKATSERNILLYSHYSGLFDKKYIELNPDAAYVNDANVKDTNFCSTFSNYSDKLLIPQIKELAIDYKLDGVWIDGDVWGAQLDYSNKARNEYKKKYHKNIKVGEITPEYLEFLRDDYRRYVKHYVDEIHKAAPKFNVATNWAFSSFLPEKPFCDVDFISGDLPATIGFNEGRFESRVLSNQNKPWDLMSWGFSYPIHHQRSALQIMQEASEVISCGGAFQLYEAQSPVASIKDLWDINNWRKVRDFVKCREPWTHKGELINDFCILYSTKSYYRYNENRLFGSAGKYNDDASGLLSLLLDSQLTTEICLTHNATKEKLKSYKAIFVPNSDTIEEELKNNVLEYTKNGGNLFLTGAETIKLFNDVLKVKINKYYEDLHFQLKSKNSQVELVGNYVDIKSKSEIINKLLVGECAISLKGVEMNPPPIIYFLKEIPSLIKVKYGKGNIYIVPFNIGTIYLKEKCYQISDYLKESLLNISKSVEVVNNPLIEVNITELNGHKYLHLINIAGQHESAFVKTHNFVPPLYNIEIQLNGYKLKNKFTLPSKEKIKIIQSNKNTALIINKIDLLETIEII